RGRRGVRESEMPNMSSVAARVFVRAALATSVAAACVTGVACFGGGKGAAPSPTASSSTATWEPAPSPSSQASPKPTEAAPASALITPSPPVLERHVYGSGERVSGETGIGFLNPTTGDFEAWTAPDRVNPGLSSSPDGQR